VRIAITQRVEDLADRGERRDALDQRWCELVERAGLAPVLVPNRVDDVTGYVEAMGADLLVLTGGNDLSHLPGARSVAPERDERERALLAYAIARGLPLLGVCRGLQLIVDALGGDLSPLAEHAGSEHAVRVVDDRWPGPGAARVRSYHDWGVRPDAVGPELVVTAYAEDGTVEGVRHADLPIVGVMWHPEREPDPAPGVALLRALAGATR
jgi:putative glutamine amidotransferase